MLCFGFVFVVTVFLSVFFVVFWIVFLTIFVSLIRFSQIFFLYPFFFLPKIYLSFSHKPFFTNHCLELILPFSFILIVSRSSSLFSQPVLILLFLLYYSFVFYYSFMYLHCTCFLNTGPFPHPTILLLQFNTLFSYYFIFYSSAPIVINFFCVLPLF